MMKEDRSAFELDLTAFLQGDIPLASHPYLELARKWKISEEEVLEHILSWQASGRIRRYVAVLRHQAAGYKVNAMVAWRVLPERADAAGQVMSGFSEVSHCYLREMDERFPFNLYTMIHSRSEEELQSLIEDMVNASGVTEYQALPTRQELKKVSMKYV